MKAARHLTYCHVENTFICRAIFTLILGRKLGRTEKLPSLRREAAAVLSIHQFSRQIAFLKYTIVGSRIRSFFRNEVRFFYEINIISTLIAQAVKYLKPRRSVFSYF